MQKAGVGTDENTSDIVGGKQYSSRSGSTGRSRMEEAGGEERRDESVVWIGRDGRESTDDGGRGQMNRVVGKV